MIDQEIPLRRLVFYVCDLCLDGAGGECHVPGCTYWLNDAPTGDTLAWLRELRDRSTPGMPRPTSSGTS
jgi:hypothetical protein